MMKTGVKYLIIIGGVLLLAGAAYSYFHFDDWYDQMREGILAEQASIQKDLKDQVVALQTEKKQKEKEIQRLQEERKELRLKYMALEGKFNELEKQLAALDVPDNPDDIAVGLRQSGLQSAVSRPAKRSLP